MVQLTAHANLGIPPSSPVHVHTPKPTLGLRRYVLSILITSDNPKITSSVVELVPVDVVYLSWIPLFQPENLPSQQHDLLLPTDTTIPLYIALRKEPPMLGLKTLIHKRVSNHITGSIVEGQVRQPSLLSGCGPRRCTSCRCRGEDRSVARPGSYPIPRRRETPAGRSSRTASGSSRRGKRHGLGISCGGIS